MLARLVVLQFAAFTAAGWLVSAVLDLTGVTSLADALFYAGLGLAVLSGLVILESSNVPLAPNLRAGTALSLTGVSDRLGLDVPVTRAQALAVVSAIVSAGGLVAAAVLVA
ncbi:MAG TPA: hypothetical protein VGN06_08400 [Gaiellaceae bacterium]